MLTWETRQSETLINAIKLTRPFDYRLRDTPKVKPASGADLGGTFNYLRVGLDVRTRRVYEDDGKRYLDFIVGRRAKPPDAASLSFGDKLRAGRTRSSRWTASSLKRTIWTERRTR